MRYTYINLTDIYVYIKSCSRKKTRKDTLFVLLTSLSCIIVIICAINTSYQISKLPCVQMALLHCNYVVCHIEITKFPSPSLESIMPTTFQSYLNVVSKSIHFDLMVTEFRRYSILIKFAFAKKNNAGPNLL